MQELIQMLPAHPKIGILFNLASAFFIILAGIFLYLYYKEFFIGENPKEWKMASIGLILYGFFTPLDILFILKFSNKYIVLLSFIQLIGPLLILIGFLKAFRQREGII